MQYHCSFCGKNQEQVKRLIAGPGAVYICDECVELCREIIDEEVSGSPQPKSASQRTPPPTEILAQLSQYVIGQDLLGWGWAADVEIAAKELLRENQIIRDILTEHTQQDEKRIRTDFDRDFFMNAQQAKDYGIIDEILAKPEEQ